jgi:hypothetical protein
MCILRQVRRDGGAFSLLHHAPPSLPHAFYEVGQSVDVGEVGQEGQARGQQTRQMCACMRCVCARVE